MRVTWRGWHLVGIRPPSGKAPMLDAYLIPSVLHRHAEEEAEAAKLALKQEHERSMSRAREVEALRSELLGKEAEGYLDTLFLSERLRISVGNKGTTFVLKRG